MGIRVFCLFSLWLLCCNVSGKITERKTFPRQMIFPNKFIPMIKGSALFKSRASSNDLSDFLKPKSQKSDSVTGQTRQNLMNSLGMDEGQAQGMGEAGGMGGTGMGGTGMGGTGVLGGAAGGGGLAGMTGGLGGGTEGEPGMDALGAQGGMGGGQGSMMGMNDQMNSMNGMNGLEGSQSSPQQNMMSNGMNSMSNGAPQGTNLGENNPPPGDPMGTLNDMMSNQGTNAALGIDSQAFGPGGDANENVVSMLNQIVGKEIPSESPVNPGSNSEQIWNQLQKNLESQKPAGLPYIDSDNSQSTTETSQQDTDAKPTNQESTGANNTEHNKTINNSSSSNTAYSAAENSPNTKPLKIQNGTSIINSNQHPQSDKHNDLLMKTTSSVADTDLDEEQPLSDDMVKFLKGIKFVISQEPGNDIILGKKFSSSPSNLNLKEENGVMKTVVTATGSHDQGDIITQYHNNAQFKRFPDNESKQESSTEVGDEEEIDNNYDALFAKPLSKESKKKYSLDYIKAANILRSASKKLKDPIAKKSTNVAIASILKVLSLGDTEKKLKPRVNVLNGGDIKNKLLDKYAEAARVLATASKKLADPVAKKSTDIGIASILKVIALGEYASKKALVPNIHKENDLNNNNSKYYEKIAQNFANAVSRTLRKTRSNL